MVIVTGRTIAGDTTLRTVALYANSLGRKQHIGCLRAMQNFMALSATHIQMLRMIEFSAREPAIHDDRLGDDRRGVIRIGDRFHFMTNAARRELCATLRGIPEEDALLKPLATDILRAQALHLFLHEFFLVGTRGQAFLARGVFRVLRGQAPEERAHKFSISMRQRQAGIVRVKL